MHYFPAARGYVSAAVLLGGLLTAASCGSSDPPVTANLGSSGEGGEPAAPVGGSGGVAGLSTGGGGCDAALNTDEHCGACDRSCEAGSTCKEGLCSGVAVVQERTPGSPWYAANVWFTKDNIYLLTTEGLRIAPRSPTTAPVTTTLVPFESYSSGLTGDDTYLYWTAGKELFKYALDGSTPAPELVNPDTGQIGSGAISLRGNTFYLAEPGPGSWRINSLPKAGGTAKEVFSGYAAGVTELVLSPSGDNIAWTLSGGEVFLGSSSGGEPAQVGKGITREGVIPRPQMDETHLYWAEPQEKRIRRISYEPGAVAEDVATRLVRPVGLLLDEQYVYFVPARDSQAIDKEETAGTKLYRVKKTGGVPPELIGSTEQSNASRLFHVDDEYVWLPYQDAGGFKSILRFSKLL